MAKNSVLGNEIKASMVQGNLIPDGIASKLAISLLEDKSMLSRYNGLIYDGYPRTLQQASFLSDYLRKNKMNEVTAVSLHLERWVAIEKLLGRMHCSKCNRGYNSAHIMSDEFRMPALLPESLCPWALSAKSTGVDSKRMSILNDCMSHMTRRDDDTKDIIIKRFDEYEEKTAPVKEFYNERQRLCTFTIKHGIEDLEALLELMLHQVSI